jgi:peptidoglycan hydrolase-like protein with peptidoglycan-binding domain
VLKRGSSGQDISRLQQFLARDRSIYPEATISGYYGELTQAAVRRWQTKYNIVSSGTPDSTGFGVTGPRTAAAIALLCAKGGGIGGSSGTPTVGGFIQIVPTSGDAPLSVDITVTVNSTLSCEGALYTLDFGDGTGLVQINVVSGQCAARSQSFKHVYQNVGSYQIKLSSGVHQTSATVVVYAPISAIGTMYSFATSGPAPFSTTLYVSCVNAPSYNIIFGDGSDLGSANTGDTSPVCNGGLQAIKHVYTKYGNFVAKLMLFVPQVNGVITPLASQTVPITVTDPTAGYVYGAPQISPTSGGDQRTATITFDLPSACTGYNVSWGDGSANAIQSDGGSACAASATVKTLTHQYAALGSYSVIVKRGPTLSRSDTMAIVLQ